MNSKIFRLSPSEFALRGARGIVVLAVVLIAAFWLGGALLGSDSSRPDGGGHEHLGSEPVDRQASWTCSMHPQIKLPKEGKCPICFMDLIPVESNSTGELDPNQLKLSEAAVQLARIQTTPVRRTYADRDVSMAGKIAYDESRVAEITAWISGRIDQLHADFTGITVDKDAPLVRIYSPQLLAAQEELVQALAAVRELANTNSRLLQVTAGAMVEAARDKLRLLGLSNDQIQDLENSGRPSDVVTIYSPVGGVVIDKKIREGMYVSTGDRLFTVADLTRLWVTFEAFESDLPWLRYGQRAVFTIYSLPGVSFEAAVSFIDPFVDPVRRTVKVRAVVNNSDGRLKPDMLVQGTIKSRLNGEGDIIDPSLAGKWISPMHPDIVKDRPGRCDVCGRPLVRAASLGYVGETADENEAPLLIPAEAPLLTGKRAVVYVDISTKDGPAYEGREVELGPRAGNFYVVKSGLDEGERVVTHGAFKIDSELQIQARPSMMSPAGGIMTAGHQHGDHPGNAAAKTEAVKPEPGASHEVSRTLETVYERYFDVQMALAKDDFKAAVGAGAKLSEQIKQVDDGVFLGRARPAWLKLSKQLASHAKNLSKAKDIASARDSFYHLSNTVIKMHESFGHSADQNYYLTFCPMARDNKGAYWLQTEDIVWNSFWGDMMLRCGSINDTLPPVLSE